MALWTTAASKEGEVILLHDADHYAAEYSWCTTVAALPLILDALAQQGLGT